MTTGQPPGVARLLERLALWLITQATFHDWASWLIHAAAALPIGALGAGLFVLLVWAGFPPAAAAAIVAVFSLFLWREVEQAIHRHLAGAPAKVRDPVLDVLVPTVAMIVVLWVLS